MTNRKSGPDKQVHKVHDCLPDCHYLFLTEPLVTEMSHPDWSGGLALCQRWFSDDCKEGVVEPHFCSLKLRTTHNAPYLQCLLVIGFNPRCRLKNTFALKGR